MSSGKEASLYFRFLHLVLLVSPGDGRFVNTRSLRVARSTSGLEDVSDLRPRHMTPATHQYRALGIKFQLQAVLPAVRV